MSAHVRHPYHLVDESPWPVVTAMGAFGLTSGFMKWFHESDPLLVVISLLMLASTTVFWWRDVSREGSLAGLHSAPVELGLRWGMALFIISEVFFFTSFFWAFFHSSLAPSLELGGQWPPAGVYPFDAFGVPFLNTVILLSSGISVTWAHHSLMKGLHSQSVTGLKITLGLGIVFMCVQLMEYNEASFTFSDSVYGSSFFMATGFHGIHVLVGSTFLAVCAQRMLNFNFASTHHFGFEAAAWYWHFVDVVWLFLFCTVYGWGAMN